MGELILTFIPGLTHVTQVTYVLQHSSGLLHSLCDDHAMGSVAGTKTATVLAPVLCVDLDGTLIRGNVMWECVLSLLRTRPWALLSLPFWLIAGKAALKQRLATHADINPARLSYRHQVVDFLEQERSGGRRIALVTAADRELAEAVARYLGLFDEIHASDGKSNLKGATKAGFLVERFKETGFEYIGDSSADLEVWRQARAAYVVGTKALAVQASAVTTVKDSIIEPSATLGTWVNALRGHHWAKNLLLFLPLVLSHNLATQSMARTLVGFVLFGCCASGLYILNDLLDLQSDRGHPWKKVRPFAAGDISIPEGLAASFILLAGSLGFGLYFDLPFGATLLGYAALTMTYSMYLKKIALLDVFVLSSFYSVRILCGALISGTPLSQWFLAFSMFFFFSVATAKRYSELLHASDLVKAGNSGRGYHVGDRELLLALGVGSSFSAVVIFSLYVHSPDVFLLYPSPQFLFLLGPIILYWLSRNWLLAHRGELKEDPVTLAITDPVSYGVAFACSIVIAASLLHLNW